MNYQYQYKNQYGNGRGNKTFLLRMARQLAVVLCMMLVVIMFKYVRTGTSEQISGTISNIMNLDYTSNINKIAGDKFTGLNQYLDKFLGGVSASSKFKFSYLPVEGEITSNFGKRTDPVTKLIEQHDGIDISVKTGTDVKLVFDGVIEKVEDNKTMGLTVTVNHNNGYKTVYGHLSQVDVNAGEDISAGCVIAKSGNTGKSTGPHLHFEVHKGNVPVDPMGFLMK